MEYSFLVDVNLPKYFKFFNNDKFIHIVDIDPLMSDTEIWEYALSNKLVILTKDSDFYYKFILSKQCPKVLYFLVGNMTISQLHQYFEINWKNIISKLASGDLLLANQTSIEIIL